MITRVNLPLYGIGYTCLLLTKVFLIVLRDRLSLPVESTGVFPISKPCSSVEKRLVNSVPIPVIKATKAIPKFLKADGLRTYDL